MIFDVKRNTEDFFQILWLNIRKHKLILFTVFSKLQRGVYISRFMEKNKHLHNSVKMMKLTFFAFCIFANQINENLADVMVPCVHHKICYGDQIGTYGQCGNGRCIKFNEDGSGYILTVNSKCLKIIVFMLMVS